MLELHLENEKPVPFTLGGLAVGDSSDDARSGKGVVLVTDSVVIPVVNLEIMIGGRKKALNSEGW